MIEKKISLLPPKNDVETKKVLRQLSLASRQLGLLNGAAGKIPNENILINTLVLQEAKDSSAVENIFTTHDEMYKNQLEDNLVTNPATKEVNKYADALKEGFQKVRKTKIINQSLILEIQSILKQNDEGYRKNPGTKIVNDLTKEVIHTPPQDYQSIINLMSNLVDFINDNLKSDLDPLIKMALIHHQFETIHPFSDGNGRTGRIINILYLVKENLIELPILYLSRYIIKNKSSYYKNLQLVRDTDNWEPWIIFILKGVEETATETVELINKIKDLMFIFKKGIRKDCHKIYSQDLLNNLFKHPYTKIEFLMNDLQISRVTATKYLNLLSKLNYLTKIKVGRNNYYINLALYNLLKNVHNEEKSREFIEPIITIN